MADNSQLEFGIADRSIPMSPQARQAIRKDADLTERVVEYYRRLFAGLIHRMNREPSARSDIECMRMCVEAVDMMLENQGRMTRALRELADDRAKGEHSAAA